MRSINIVVQYKWHMVHIMSFHKHNPKDGANRSTSLLRCKSITHKTKLVPVRNHQRNKKEQGVVTKELEYQLKM